MYVYGHEGPELQFNIVYCDYGDMGIIYQDYNIKSFHLEDKYICFQWKAPSHLEFVSIKNI